MPDFPVHLGYCSNIHPGESWATHFAALRQSIPGIKEQVSPDAPMGLGLRLANQASLDLLVGGNLTELQRWLAETGVYVFTMNGFPYGGFHGVVVKDQVHAPDWTTPDRVDYTRRLFRLLAKLLPESFAEGGISTSPLSYRFWWKTPEALHQATKTATQHLLDVVDDLLTLREQTGKLLHLDLEPEPDGILESGPEFLAWYERELQPAGVAFLGKTRGLSAAEATDALRDHVRLCYDVCHFAVGYEDPRTVLDQLENAGIRVGKIQISSALKADLTENAAEKIAALARFDEPTYLHQVVARRPDGGLDRYRDLPQALAAFRPENHAEWRVHFHVPLFLQTYGLLESTQADLVTVLELFRRQPFTHHLEVETYTWGVLPANAQMPLDESISREMAWVKQALGGEKLN